ncbi:carbohydrate kinase family protein [Cellulomonas sp. P5_E12]
MTEQRPLNLVCVGNLTVDQAVIARRSSLGMGGDALYAGLAARLAGARVKVVAPIGNDAPDELRAAVALTGTDPEGLPHRDEPTVRNRIDYAADGSRRWTLETGDEHFERMSIHPHDVDQNALTADAILLSAMGLHAQLEVAQWLVGRTRATVYFDPQEDYVAGNEGSLLDAVAACDVFLPSEVEACALAGTTDPVAAARFFLTRGPGVVVVKLAERGCVVVTADESVHVPADVVEPVDSTGAGDAFCGAFAAVHLRVGAVEAARFATGIARTAVLGVGVDGLVRALREKASAA